MTDKKGVRGKPDPNSLRRSGVRLPPIRTKFAALLEAIHQARGGTKAGHIERALIAYARESEVEAAGLIE